MDTRTAAPKGARSGGRQAEGWVMLMRLSRAGALGLALALGACASVPTSGPGTVFSGRLAVRSDGVGDAPGRASSGQFELSGTPSEGALVLDSPLGTIVARARWSNPAGADGQPTAIDLDANGRTRHFESLDAMMREALGDSLPLAAMFDWLAGRPWPGAPVTRTGAAGSFDQLGWHVDLSQYDSARLVAADRADPAPALHVRVKLDPPDPAASTPR